MIKANVIYNGQYIKDSDYFNNKKTRRGKIIRSIFEIILFSALALLYYALSYKIKLGTELVIFAFIFLLLALLALTQLIKMLRSGKKLLDTPPSEETREFIFDDEQFTFIKKGTISEIKREFSYNDLYGVTETKNYFFVNMYKNLVAIIGKNDFTEGSPQELRELLARKMSDRFVIELEDKI